MNRRTFLKTLSAFGIAAVFPLAKSAKAATTHEVAIKGFKFRPANLTVAVGDTITFTNMEGIPHTASANNGSFDSGTLGRNDAADVVVTADMAGGFFCKFHPNMKGDITIG